MAIDVGVFQIIADKQGDPAIVAKAAEDLGFNSYWVPEHAILPVSFKSSYVGDPDSEAPPPPDYLWQMPDPWIALTRAAGSTSEIRLGTGICLVPEHNPLILGKAIASLDAYCDGRIDFGIGAGWNREESEILGVDFDHRWTQTRECIYVMKSLWTENESEFHGKYYNFPPVRSFPKPVQRPHPPVFLASSGSDRVFKRVVEYGAGWIPILRSLEDVKLGRARLDEAARAAGRNPADFTIRPFTLEGMFRTKADRDALEAAGANEQIVWLQGRTVAELVPELKALAKELID